MVAELVIGGDEIFIQVIWLFTPCVTLPGQNQKEFVTNYLSKVEENSITEVSQALALIHLVFGLRVAMQRMEEKG
jgi:uncharacterized membrane protein YciS (DUF1049 family)